MLRGIRGATTVKQNTPEQIKNAVIELITEIINQNSIDISSIACVNFTMTKDLNCAYPAKYAREIDGFSLVPLLCYQELDIKNSLEKCIRILILFNTNKTQNEIKHIYLNEAITLRQDLNT